MGIKLRIGFAPYILHMTVSKLDSLGNYPACFFVRKALCASSFLVLFQVRIT